MSRLGLTRDKIYKTVARQLHGVVPCWVCGQPVLPHEATNSATGSANGCSSWNRRAC